jgi:hypothetical protein
MGARLATPPSGMPAASAVDVLWLDTLQRICARAAHELKGALNGVSVNLEVVRSRVGKPDAPASAVRSYANSAVDQFDIVIEMSAALLAVGREVRGQVEIGGTVRHLVVLLARSVKVDGRRLEIEGSLAELGVTSVEGNAPRLAIGACLLSAIDASAHVVCSAARDSSSPVVRIVCSDDAVLNGPAPSVVEAAAEAGIRIQAERSAISIVFPR